jgi:polyisoprenoid-binding protein YceI
MTAVALLAFAASAWLLPAAPARAQAERYALDPVHTRVMFELSHAGYSQAIGTVSGSTGELVFDPGDWSSAKVSVTVPVARLDLGDAGWNHAALASGMLDGARHPVATFVSTRVEPVDATHARVAGTLTLRGVSREVVLDVAFNQLKRYPLPPFRRTIGFSATATISRAAFGADAWRSLVGDQVSLRIEAEARRVRGNAADAVASPPESTP